MKATVSTQFKGFEGVFDVGDVVEIEVIRHEEDLWSTRMVKSPTPSNPDRTLIERYVEIKKGSFKDFRVVSKTGGSYRGWDFLCVIGYRTLSEIFTKN